jgi:nitrogen fixation protein NifU and related proteins
VLYSSVIRDRFRQPRWRGRLEAPDATFEDVNPLCGDRIRIECRLDDGRLAAARHSGDSCAISIASADLLLEAAVGEPIEQILKVSPADLLERLDADIRPTRMKCVTLPLQVLHGALSGKEVTR